MRAVLLTRSQAVGQIPSCCVQTFKTGPLNGRRDVTLSLRFGTPPEGGHFSFAVGAECGGRLSQRQAQALAKGASEVPPPPETVRTTESTQESQVKICPECQHSKLLVDFEKTVTTMDGRTEICRACLAVLRAKSTQKELHHLGISVTEAWERAKACRKCGVTKELRDFARASQSKGQTYPYCRACTSAIPNAWARWSPPDQPLRCNRCGKVKAANASLWSNRVQ